MYRWLHMFAIWYIYIYIYTYIYIHMFIVLYLHRYTYIIYIHTQRDLTICSIYQVYYITILLDPHVAWPTCFNFLRLPNSCPDAAWVSHTGGINVLLMMFYAWYPAHVGWRSGYEKQGWNYCTTKPSEIWSQCWTEPLNRFGYDIWLDFFF